jgi:hypoxanthine-DNA glycosylase
MKGITEMAEILHLTHSFGPLYDPESRVLILGSFPSVKSREAGFFYGHPQNRFWKVIAALTKRELPSSIPEKKALLHESHIALWDTIFECDIKGSSDSSIRNVSPTDLGQILQAAEIRQIFCNGQTSGKLFQRYQEKSLGRSARILPSTSPANAAYSCEKLIQAWLPVADALADP